MTTWSRENVGRKRRRNGKLDECLADQSVPKGFLILMRKISNGVRPCYEQYFCPIRFYCDVHLLHRVHAPQIRSSFGEGSRIEAMPEA